MDNEEDLLNGIVYCCSWYAPACHAAPDKIELGFVDLFESRWGTRFDRRRTWEGHAVTVRRAAFPVEVVGDPCNIRLFIRLRTCNLEARDQTLGPPTAG